MKKTKKKIKKFEIQNPDGSISRGPGKEPLKKPLNKSIKDRWTLLKAELDSAAAFMPMAGEDEQGQEQPEQGQEQDQEQPEQGQEEEQNQEQDQEDNKSDDDEKDPFSYEDFYDHNLSQDEGQLEEQPEEISEEDQKKYLKEKGYSDPEINFIIHGHHPASVSKEEADTHKHTQGLTHKNNEHKQTLDHREIEAGLRHDHMKRMNDNEYGHDSEIKRIEREHKKKELELKLKLMEQQAKGQ